MKVDWQRAEEVFHRILELPRSPTDSTREPPRTAERQLIEDYCAGEPALAAAVRELLEAHDLDQGPLSRPIPWTPPPAAPESPGLDDGSFYPYRLLRQLGQGGMGSVYLAERIDARFEKQVAIKVLAPLRDHPGLVRRFASERQVLAKLEHPNLCRLLDAGETTDGTPYAVLEYITGQTLLRHCDGERLSLDARLELFRQICSAVHYAHQNLVVHRDIKPGNILIDGEGRPKLLDFGLAKLLAEAEDPSPASAEPRTLFALTPDYASPEQWTGEPVSTASDIYSLGILLYELLLGFRPYDFEGKSLAEISSWVRAGSIPQPSLRLRQLRTAAQADQSLERQLETAAAARRISPRALERRMAGDLDNILLRSTRHAAAERYESAAQLSEDIRRTLCQLPIVARPASTLYRLRKLIGRQKRVAVLVLISILSTLALLASLVSQVRQSEATRDRALAIAGLLIDGVQHSDPLGIDAPGITASAFLMRARETVEGELSEAPELQVTLLNKIGAAMQNLGDYDPAIELHTRALAISRQEFAEPHVAIATALEELSTVLRRKGEFSASLPLARESLAMHSRLFGDHHRATATSLENLAEIYHELGNFPRAEPLYLRALAIRRQAGDAIPLAATLDYLGLFHRNTGDSAAALAAYSEAGALRRSHLPTDHVLHARSAYNQAGLHLERNELVPAERLFRSALATYRQALGDEHPTIGQCLNDLGLVTSLADRLEEAEAFHRQALQLRQKVLEETHVDIAQSLLNLGRLLIRAGRFEPGGELLERCLTLCRSTLEPDHPYIGLALLGQAELADHAGDPAAAERLASQGIELLTRTFGGDHWRTAEATASRAGYLAQLGRLGEAEPAAQWAYQTLLRVFGPQDARSQQAHRQLRVIREALAETVSTG